MTTPPDPERLKKIFRMLFEMATGNLTFRITDSRTDELKNITVQLTFVTGDKRLMPAFCIVSGLLYSDRIVVSCVSTQPDEMIALTAQHSYGKPGNKQKPQLCKTSGIIYWAIWTSHCPA